MTQQYNFIGHTAKVDRERTQLAKAPCSLTPFRAQAVVFDILKNHLICNQPKDLGYPMEETYNVDETKSKIFIDMSNNWKASSPQKRPAVFVYRGNAEYDKGVKLIGANSIGMNVAESEEDFITTVSMPIMLNCIYYPIGGVEIFADYIKHPFLYFQKEIQAEYCFSKFRVASISAPEQYEPDAKTSFSVKITLDVEFKDIWRIKGDHLKLKTIGLSTALYPSEKPLENQ